MLPATVWSGCNSGKGSEHAGNHQINSHHITLITHTCKQLDSGTARVVFEYTEGFHTWRKLSIHRISFSGLGGPAISRGAVLGRDVGEPSALILDVRQRDLVVIRSRERKESAFTCRYFRIGHDWVPRRLDLACASYWQQEVIDQVEICDIDADRQVDSCDLVLMEFLAESHPAWLDDILSRQVEHWRQNRLERFLRLAPSKATSDEIALCIINYPLIALAHFKNCLSRRQTKSCVRRSLRGAVMHAFEELSPALVNKAVVDHPHEMIRYAAHKLTDSQLLECAQCAPYAAFQCRSGMPPARRAAMLAISYPYCAVYYYRKPAALRLEFIDSITNHPPAWLFFHNQSYSELFRCLRNRLGLIMTVSDLQELMKGTPEEYHQPLLIHIAGHI